MSPDSLAVSHLSSAPQVWAGIWWNDLSHILLTIELQQIVPGKTEEEKLNKNRINKLSMCQRGNVSQTLPGSGRPQGDSQEGQMCTKLSLNLLMVGPALTRKNILSDKNSHLGEGKNLIIWRGFSSHCTPYTHLQSFLHKSNHLCYSLLEGDKPGSSMLENAEETLPCLFSKGEAASKDLSKERSFVSFLLKVGDRGYRESGIQREGYGMKPHMKTNYWCWKSSGSLV